jgi:hypothetical protein
MPGDRKRTGQRCRQSGRSEAGLGRGAVLVDDPTQHVVASNVAERRGSRGHCADRCGHFESKTTVRPMLVVVPDVVEKDGFEVVATENEHPVEPEGCKRTIRPLTIIAVHLPRSSEWVVRSPCCSFASCSIWFDSDRPRTRRTSRSRYSVISAASFVARWSEKGASTPCRA